MKGPVKRKSRDTICSLYEFKTLTVEHVRAAEALYTAELLMTDGWRPSKSKYQSSVDEVRDPDWSASQLDTVKRSRAWRSEMVRLGWAIGPVISILTEDLGLRKAERVFHMKTGSVTRKLIDALQLYAELAGWVRRSRFENQAA